MNKITGMDSAHATAKEMPYGSNMTVSAALIIDIAERNAELEKKLSLRIKRINAAINAIDSNSEDCKFEAVEENELLKGRVAELEKERDEEVEEIIKHRIEMQKAVENVSGCGDCVLIPMQIWESLTSVYYNHKSVSLKAHNLEQQQLAVTRFANKYCGDCTTDYQVRLSAESMMYCKRLEALKESKS